jgi:ketosteroid isomerase-like protein
MPPRDLTPLETARAFLAGIKNRSKASMHELCHPDATACLIRNGKPKHFTIVQILERIPDDSPIDMDEVSYDEVEHVDGVFATVWTPYKFYEDGKVM